MCDVSKGAGRRGGDRQRNIHMTFLMEKIDMRGFPKEDINQQIKLFLLLCKRTAVTRLHTNHFGIFYSNLRYPQSFSDVLIARVSWYT